MRWGISAIRMDEIFSHANVYYPAEKKLLRREKVEEPHPRTSIPTIFSSKVIRAEISASSPFDDFRAPIIS